MSDEIMAIDVLNYPFTPEGMKKFWASVEMKEMAERVLGGHTPEGMAAEQFIADMDDAGFEKVFIVAVKMGSYRGRWLANDFNNQEVYEMIKGYPDRLVGMAGYDAGARVLTEFFRRELTPYLEEAELDGLGRDIIECCLRGGTVEDYVALLGAD